MDAAALPVTFACVAVLALALIAHAVVRRRRLEAAVARAWLEVPRDEATGLLDRRVCVQRLAAELKRAARGAGSVWVGVVTVLDGDADRVGRLLHDGLRPPEVGFRLAPQVLVVARPDVDPARREELLGRIRGAAPRERLTVSETTWRSAADGDAAAVLARASARPHEVTIR